jgi:hypothetical protein
MDAASSGHTREYLASIVTTTGKSVVPLHRGARVYARRYHGERGEFVHEAAWVREPSLIRDELRSRAVQRSRRFARASLSS